MYGSMPLRILINDIHLVSRTSAISSDINPTKGAY